MSEHVSQHREAKWHHSADNELMPDDAYIVPERIIGALDAAQRAREWLDQHPATEFGASPPDDKGLPEKATTDDEIDALIAEAEALAKTASQIVVA